MSDTSKLRCGERKRPMTMPRQVVICWSRVYTRLLRGLKLYVALRPALAMLAMLNVRQARGKVRPSACRQPVHATELSPPHWLRQPAPVSR